MYGGRGTGGVVVGGGVGGLATTGSPIMLTLLLSFALLVAGLLALRWGTVRRDHDS